MAMTRSSAALAFATAVATVDCSSQPPAALRGAATPEIVSPLANRSRALSSIDYVEYFDRNAYQPFGATDLDTDATAPEGLTTQECEDRCTSDARCMCASWERDTGKCWKRADCVPYDWTSSNNIGYNVFMKRGYVPSGWFQLRLYTDMDKCIRVRDHESSDGTPVELWPCDEFWSVDDADANVDGPVNWATHPQKCLDVKDGKNSIGTPLQISECKAGGYPSQQFFLDYSSWPASSEGQSIPRPIGRLRWKEYPNKCVVSANGDSSTGNTIVLADCSDDDSHYWVNDYVER